MINTYPKIKIGKAKDLTNKKFGKLTALYRTNNHVAKNGRERVQWVCKCDCGNYTIVTADHFNETQSCGCLQKEKAANNLKDLTGKTFGKFTVLKRDKDKNNHTYWICKCECGQIKSVASSSLIQGISLSCGCLGKSKGEYLISQILKENNIKFETQKTFETCRFKDTNALARFDFYLSDYNILIEYDGERHFKASGYGWNTKENLLKVKQHDNYKNRWCQSNNIKLIRISYTDYDKINWNYIKKRLGL